MTDPNELRRLAEAATPGPWEATEAGLIQPAPAILMGTIAQLWGGSYQEDFDNAEANRAFIAAANPAAILALLDRYDLMRSFIAGLSCCCIVGGPRCSRCQALTGESATTTAPDDLPRGFTPDQDPDEAAANTMLLEIARLKAAQRWIAVGDQPPNRGDEVLTWSPVEGRRLMHYGAHPAGFPAGVTHWMLPLAAPSKEPS